MPELNYKNIKSPHELRRLAVLAEVGTKELKEMTGLNGSTIDNYFNEGDSRQNYLFQFALEYLAEENLKKLKNNI